MGTLRTLTMAGGRSGGGKRDRTADLLHAMQALSQLSYTPTRGRKLYHAERCAWRRSSTRFLPASASMGPRLGVCARPNTIIRDRKSTRLNSSHSQISYAVFCLKKKKKNKK